MHLRLTVGSPCDWYERLEILLHTDRQLRHRALVMVSLMESERGKGV